MLATSGAGPGRQQELRYPKAQTQKARGQLGRETNRLVRFQTIVAKAASGCAFNNVRLRRSICPGGDYFHSNRHSGLDWRPGRLQ